MKKISYELYLSFVDVMHNLCYYFDLNKFVKECEKRNVKLSKEEAKELLEVAVGWADKIGENLYCKSRDLFFHSQNIETAVFYCLLHEKPVLEKNTIFTHFKNNKVLIDDAIYEILLEVFKERNFIEQDNKTVISKIATATY